MVAINALFVILSAIYVVLGVTLLVYPTSYSFYGFDVSQLAKYLASPFNTYSAIPRLAGQLISLSSVLFYATTMPSAHDKAKIARGVLFALIGRVQSSVVDQYVAKQSVFTKPQSGTEETLGYVRLGVSAVLAVWCFVECFSATADDAQPTSTSAKKNNRASTGGPVNTTYLRALSLLWLVEGVLVWFAPQHLQLLGYPSQLYSTSLLSDFSTAIAGALFVAASTICGYGATFQSVHDQAKLARSFLWYWLITLGYSVYGEFVAHVKTGVSDQLRYGHLAVSAVFVVLSLVVSFSATKDDVRNPAVKTTIKKKQ